MISLTLALWIPSEMGYVCHHTGSFAEPQSSFMQSGMSHCKQRTFSQDGIIAAMESLAYRKPVEYNSIYKFMEIILFF